MVSAGRRCCVASPMGSIRGSALSRGTRPSGAFPEVMRSPALHGGARLVAGHAVELCRRPGANVALSPRAPGSSGDYARALDDPLALLPVPHRSPGRGCRNAAPSHWIGCRGARPVLRRHGRSDPLLRRRGDCVPKALCVRATMAGILRDLDDEGGFCEGDGPRSIAAARPVCRGARALPTALCPFRMGIGRIVAVPGAAAFADASDGGGRARGARIGASLRDLAGCGEHAHARN
jgi:hypothetical protein